MSDRRVVLVTGSTDGIGRATARALAAAGIDVVLHGRSKPKVEATIAQLQAELPGATLTGVSFDLGKLESVRKGAAQILEQSPALHGLVNNAGIFATERTMTADHLELTFAVNYVGPFLLTSLLAPRLVESADAVPSRVVNVASVAHTRGRIDEDLSLRTNWTGYTAYAQSKLANVMHAITLAEKFDPEQLVAYSLHPGVIGTKLLKQGFGPVGGNPVEHGARAITRLVTGDVTEPSGTYFNESLPAQAAANARDPNMRERLWSASERLCGL